MKLSVQDVLVRRLEADMRFHGIKPLCRGEVEILVRSQIAALREAGFVVRRGHAEGHSGDGSPAGDIEKR